MPIPDKPLDLRVPMMVPGRFGGTDINKTYNPPQVEPLGARHPRAPFGKYLHEHYLRGDG